MASVNRADIQATIGQSHSHLAVVVTGAASGIGRAVVRQLNDLGARVLGVDIDETGLLATAESCPEPDRFERLTIDIAGDGAADEIVTVAARRLGGLTTIVNNAAVSVPGTAVDTEVTDFDRSFAVNVRAPFLLIKSALPYLRRSGGGSIVNIGSVNSVVAERELLSYCTTKGALMMLTKSVAVDHASEGIRCNIVCPGYVDTPLNRAHSERMGGYDRVREMVRELQPLGRDGRANEVAEVVAFLASDASSFVTGSSIMVDGGFTAGR